MNRTYGIIHNDLWRDPAFVGLTGDQRLLLLYLHAGPHTTMLGCFMALPGYIAQDLQWPIHKAEQTLDELGAVGFITHDRTSQWVLVHMFLAWNPVNNPSQMRAIEKLFVKVPSRLMRAAAHEIRQFCKYPLRHRVDTVPTSGTGPVEDYPSQGGKISGKDVVYIHAHTHMRRRTREGGL